MECLTASKSATVMASLGTVCPLCKKDFHRPAWLARHKERKTPCVQHDPRPAGQACGVASEANDDALASPLAGGQFRCLGCGKTFANRFTVVRHIREACTGESAKTSVGEGPHGIAMNVFGEEDTDHITAADIARVVRAACGGAPRGELSADRLRAAGTMAVVLAAERIFGDADHPENITCFLPNKSDKLVMQHTAGGWQFSDLQRVTVPMAVAAIALLVAKQPMHDWKDGTRAEIAAAQQIITHVSKNEDAICAAPPTGLVAVLYSNKGRLALLLPRLPKFGDKMGAARRKEAKAAESGAIGYVLNTLKRPIPAADDEKEVDKFIRQCAAIIDPMGRADEAEQRRLVIEAIRAEGGIEKEAREKLLAVCGFNVT
ncbi:MAG: hypothetical protein KGL39_09460 [Patescibacteria group bacterium]|nr:hypothetical protein [Patescibacteria group bacterium]